jgi:hypothetical protein
MKLWNVSKWLAVMTITTTIVILAGNSPIIAAGSIGVDNDMKREMIDLITEKINEIYIFPDIASEIDDQLHEILREGEYDNYNTLSAFIDRLNTDLYGISQDRHLRIFPLSKEFCAKFDSDEAAADDIIQSFSTSEFDNYGFYCVEILDGNIGYLDLRTFAEPKRAYDHAMAAMMLLKGSDAVIIDLRKNGGGDGGMVWLIASFFFDERTRLNDAYYRKGEFTEQHWTVPVPFGDAFVEKALYILIGNVTFSAAEDFAYAMQAHKRATLIGEKTRGGGHPIELLVFRKYFITIDIPNAYSINSVTGTNWEKVGVLPDIEIPFEETFDYGYRLALQNIYNKTDDEDKRNEIQWVIQGLDYKQNPVDVSETTLQKYAGDYEGYKIVLDKGKLYHERTDKSRFRLIPLTENLFTFVVRDKSRIRFITDESGKVTEAHHLNSSGGIKIYKRN